MFKTKNSAGMTLIELMLSLTLSFLIISSVLEIYLLAENTRHLQSNIITLQENAEIISLILKNNIKASSWFGCAKLTDDFPFKNHLPFLLNQKNHIVPYQSDQVKAGSDAVQIWHSSIRSDVILKKMQGNSALYISSGLRIVANDNLIISDCRTAEAFRVKEVIQMKDKVQKIIPAKPLDKIYEKNSEINKLEMEAFFIGKTKRFNEKHNAIYAFYSKDMSGKKTEWIENVSQMKIFFSVLQHNRLVDYPIASIKNADDIKGVSFDLDLILRSKTELHKNWNIYVALS